MRRKCRNIDGFSTVEASSGLRKNFVPMQNAFCGTLFARARRDSQAVAIAYSKSWRLLEILVAGSIGWLGGKRRRCQKPGSGRKIEKLHHVVGVRVAQRQWRHVERVFNQAQDRSVVARGVRHETRSCPGRKHDDRYAKPALVELARLIRRLEDGGDVVRLQLAGWAHVIIQTATFVISEDERRSGPRCAID